MAFGIESGLPTEGRVACGDPRGKRDTACDHGFGLIIVGTGNRYLDAAVGSPEGPCRFPQNRHVRFDAQARLLVGFEKAVDNRGCLLVVAHAGEVGG